MKESPRRYTNPFLSDEENEKISFWNNQELEHSNIKDGLTNSCEDEKFRKSLEQSNLPSEFFKKETELYTDRIVMECKLPEFIVCYKESAFHVKNICVDEGIPHGERILFDEDNHEIRISSPANEGKHGDKIEDSLYTRFLKPELLRFPRTEDNYVESNLCSGTNRNANTDLLVPEQTNSHLDIGDNCDGVMESNLDTEIPVQDFQNSIPDNDFEDSTTKECGTNEDVDSVVPNELKNMSRDHIDDEDGRSERATDNLEFSPESDTVPKATNNHGPDMSVQVGEEQINSSANSLNNASTMQQDRPFPSLKSLIESIDGAYDIDQQPPQGPIEEMSKSPVVGYEAEELGKSVQTTIFSNETTMEGSSSLNLNHDKSATTSSGLNGVENPKNVGMVNPAQHGEGESSFSVAGHISGLITYSGPISFSGSTSLRSDSSTTSTRSFAFPILQTEWNISPVRMAKGDRRGLQKHRGWMHGILCCRF